VAVIGTRLAWWIWSLAVVFVIYVFSFQTGYSVVSSGVQKDVGLSVSQVATIAAVYTWAFALCQFFGGALLDRLGSRRVFAAVNRPGDGGCVHVRQRRQLRPVAAVAGHRRHWLLYRVRGRGIQFASRPLLAMLAIALALAVYMRETYPKSQG
jgi:MFS family permease